MLLDSTLDDIVTKLREGRFPNEAAISTGIVLRVLNELNWDVHDAEVVWPEYNVGKGRVDFALCDPPSKPRVFIEVKQPGAAQAEGSIEQALLYAFRTGVHYIVLTDGRTWNLYLPSEPGTYEERCVLRLDLYERLSLDPKDALAHYLEYGRVASGEALEAARKEYRDRMSRDTARRELPAAWSELVRRGDESLVRLLSDAVEAQTKLRPIDADVLGYLRSLKGSGNVDNIQVPSDFAKPSEPEKSNHKAIIVAGKPHEYKSFVGAMVTVLTELHKVNQGFLDQLAKHPGIKRRTRTVLAKNAADIYPKSPHLRNKVGQLPDDWLVCTNFYAEETMKVINIAADVSGMTVEWDPPIRDMLLS